MEFLASLPTLKNRGNHPDGEENKTTTKKDERERDYGDCKSSPQRKTSIF